MRLDRQFEQHKEAILALCERVFSHGRVLQGPEVAALEDQLCGVMGTNRAVAVGSATDALFFTLVAAGINAGDRVAIPCHKIASALATHDDLLRKIASTGRPVLMSTGMSTMEQIRHAVKILDSDNFMLAHCTSSYPAAYQELNLTMLQTLAAEFDCPVGYSGHEAGLSTTIASVVLGATFVERHVTLNRTLWGSHMIASVEPQGMTRLARYIRIIESALPDGVKKVYDSELPIIAKLRGN